MVPFCHVEQGIMSALFMAFLSAPLHNVCPLNTTLFFLHSTVRVKRSYSLGTKSKKTDKPGRTTWTCPIRNACFNFATVFLKEYNPGLYLLAVNVWLKMVVSLKELHRIREWTLGDLCVCSANFWARKPPREAPNRWTYNNRNSLTLYLKP